MYASQREELSGKIAPTIHRRSNELGEKKFPANKEANCVIAEHFSNYAGCGAILNHDEAQADLHTCNTSKPTGKPFLGLANAIKNWHSSNPLLSAPRNSTGSSEKGVKLTSASEKSPETREKPSNHWQRAKLSKKSEIETNGVHNLRNQSSPELPNSVRAADTSAAPATTPSTTNAVTGTFGQQEKSTIIRQAKKLIKLSSSSIAVDSNKDRSPTAKSFKFRNALRRLSTRSQIGPEKTLPSTSCVDFHPQVNENPHYKKGPQQVEKMSLISKQKNAPNYEELRIKHNLDQQTMDQFRESFRVFDRNGDDRICTKELGTAMRFLGYSPSPEQLASMVKEADEDGNGTIEFNEFISLMSRHLEIQKEKNAKNDYLGDVFHVFDKNKDGYITAKELKDVMTSLGENLTDQELQGMINAADTDGDGRINFQEFKLMWRDSRS